ASICAVEDGKSVDTSFGMSLQTGLIHANRTGDLDWGLLDFLEMQGLTREEINTGLTKKGGLLGISGVSNDVRYVQEAADAGNERAALALSVFTTGIVRYAGAFTAEMGGLDYLAFTGGIGENSAFVRKEVCRHLAFLGLSLDEEKNKENAWCISAPDSAVGVYVIPANEELIVARQTYQCGEES
ncbi:MAG: acetate kinase, partial [Eubacterium sp.]|nr:acetate kinase [Eubacterium sp.]